MKRGSDAQPYGGAGGDNGEGWHGGGNPGGGTGGLLVVSSFSLSGKGSFKATGYSGGAPIGSSGGGSINIFYKDKEANCDIHADVVGQWKTLGEYAGHWVWICGSSINTYNGGAGSFTIGSVSTGYFVED